jgi:hypothetical protein
MSTKGDHPRVLHTTVMDGRRPRRSPTLAVCGGWDSCFGCWSKPFERHFWAGSPRCSLKGLRMRKTCKRTILPNALTVVAVGVITAADLSGGDTSWLKMLAWLAIWTIILAIVIAGTDSRK